MSLATRCSHCGTIFKVVQDQLKVSEGWVRCGRCNEVFNALPALFDLDKDPPPPRPAQVSAPAVSTPEARTPPQPTPAPEPAPVASSPGAMTGGMAHDVAHNIADTTANDLGSQALLSDEELNLGIESQPPDGWERTQPANFASSRLPPSPEPTRAPLQEDDLALDPTPIEGTTDFELDTAIAVDDNTPLEVVLAATSRGRVPPAPAAFATPQPMAEPEFESEPAAYAQPAPSEPAPQPWLDEPPEDVPSTDEADALDSRYLMPSERERRAPHRRGRGPEFADAQFPSDAMIDAEEDWASDFGPSSLHDEPPAAPAQTPAPAPLPKPGAAPTSALRAPAAAPTTSLAPQRESEDDLSTQPSRFADEQENELALPPPSARPGKSGTRGRAPGDQTPEFLKRAQRKAFWRHPAVRGVLSLMALSLLLTLGLQMVHQFRDLVAAYHPASRPLLTQWCDMVGCKLAPPLRLEALQVDNLELVRTTSEGPDIYRLTVVVHNQAGIDLAWPHVDLTLTDDSGAVIARRVFSPHDAQWLDTADAKADAARAAAPAASIPTAAPSQRSTTLQWRLKATDLHPAGYTAELFYP
ncbi:hypothetical protein JY96_07330 [Aquabacterium sp. NJ1]|uniref:zinc-ribbon and DUF3426 domain-containing protein n=1 Tax=Aquabacterium sp. NJ1 TaxID=1538295 RepID=UPI00052C5EB8|nr:zinc-ribbon and DUF3426 domain-containing protein [Aquabacterium sp. NJ1]KGM39904.1 hypothetical protein JY96_07330 [Aquabacterium sp. NJ1]